MENKEDDNIPEELEQIEMNEDEDGNLKMPEWMDCTWRRKGCGDGDCPICGKIKQQREVHAAEGEDPDSAAAVTEDLASELSEVVRMIKEDADRMGIDISNLDDVEMPPGPTEFELMQDMQSWLMDVFSVVDVAKKRGDFWVRTEAAADIFWYVRTLTEKTYRQLTNRWHLQQGDSYGEFDHRYTAEVLDKVIIILHSSFHELAEVTDDNVELAALHRRLNTLTDKIADI